MEEKITVIFTCYNRKDKTVAAMKSIVEKNPSLAFHFIMVDDCSTDGTVDAIKHLNYDVEIIQGTGSLFWCGGMRVGIEKFLNSNPSDEGLCLLINDDVLFFDNSIEQMFKRLGNRDDYVIVGATCDDSGEFTYGLKIKQKWYQKNMTKPVKPSKDERIGDTCNANCVLIPNNIMKEVGNMDSVYTHSLGDYDYGYRMSRNGYKLISSEEYVGICNSNAVKGTWADTTLSRKERLQKKEEPKGSPRKEFWHFVKVNYGLFDAVWYTVVSYLKILIKK